MNIRKLSWEEKVDAVAWLLLFGTFVAGALWLKRWFLQTWPLLLFNYLAYLHLPARHTSLFH
jgi:hypothetical protein